MVMARALCQLKSSMIMASAKESRQGSSGAVVQERIRNSTVLVLGGTGRVGGSTAIALSKLCPDLQIVVGGRNREKGDAMVGTLGKNSEFAEVDINDVGSLEAALSGAVALLPLSLI